jgi:putative membrane protein
MTDVTFPPVDTPFDRNTRTWPSQMARSYVCLAMEVGMSKLLTLTMVTAGLAAAGATVQAQGINDAQIAAIVVTANQVDVDAGKLAGQRARSAEVKTFAERMVSDHEGVNRQALALATKLTLTPQENDTSKALKAGGDSNLARLRTLTGNAFDRAYVDHEIAYHAQVLDALDKTLIPGAANAELKALLVKVRPAFVAHLEHAKHLKASLSGAGTR